MYTAVVGCRLERLLFERLFTPATHGRGGARPGTAGSGGAWFYLDISRLEVTQLYSIDNRPWPCPALSARLVSLRVSLVRYVVVVLRAAHSAHGVARVARRSPVGAPESGRRHAAAARKTAS